MNHSHPTSHPNDRSRERFFSLAAAISVFILIVAGGIVSATGSGGACPDWPTCLGAWTPPAAQNALIDYAHRVSTLIALPFVLGSAWIISRRQPRSLASRAAWSAVGLLGIQIGLGAAVALGAFASAQGTIKITHMLLSLLTLTAAVIPAVLSFYPEVRPLRFQSPFARLVLLTLAALLLLMASGALIQNGAAGCEGWPLCGNQPVLSPVGWLNLSHRLIVAGTAALTAILLLRAWKTQRSQTPILSAATAAAVLFFAQALLGAKLVQGFPTYLLALHQATAAAAWTAMWALTITAGMAGRSDFDERMDVDSIAGRKGLARDLLMLTKPIVVLLLLVTTYAGMVIGAQAWPDASITFWTLLGGFLAAGGSGAINQYIDRNDDVRMQRTQKRPIPAGRLTPGEGLAFGIGIALASFYLLTAFVNLLAALLSLAGIIYYVLLYSIFLKKTTVQNIVIGGGAGAIPPLVGWAAATGSLNFPSLFLFAIVFMWTPPHFWALALVRRSDYARAGVPMLPVVRGEAETRKQIFIYTVELVALSLLLPLFGLGGSIYLIGAVMLGGWLLSAAWRVHKQGGNKLAWKMYRYSSMYLAFLFMALMIDRIL